MDRLILISILLLSFIYSPFSFAGNTSSIGGQGGISSFNYHCPTNTRVAGIKISYTEVIDDVSFYCRTITSEGKWAHISKQPLSPWTKMVRSGHVTHQKSILCPADTFVGGIAGRTFYSMYTKGLTSITLGCFKSNSSGGKYGSRSDIQVQIGNNNRGEWTGFKICPSGEIAYRGFGRRGVFLDSIALGCKKGTSAPPPRKKVLPTKKKRLNGNLIKGK